MTHTSSPTDLMLTGNETHALKQNAQPGDVIFTRRLETTEDGRPAEKEILLGVVAEDGESLTEPRGAITRLAEEHSDEHMHTYFRLYPAGESKRVHVREVFPRRADQTPPEDDLCAVRDVESFD